MYNPAITLLLRPASMPSIEPQPMFAPRRLVLALVLLLTGSLACGQERMAQICEPAKDASTPTARFKSGAAGTVADRQTGLLWMRCAMGQQWNGSDCAGPPRAYPWAAAFDAATALNSRGGYGGHTDWRVPTLAELASLVEHRCYDPAINLELFPSSPITGFWSADPHASPDHAMMIHFKYGRQYMGNKNQYWALRLVRKE
jgi:hypothetical protein